MMPGVALGEFQQALTNAFDSADLAQLVRIHLNEQLAGITAPGPQKLPVGAEPIRIPVGHPGGGSN